MNDAHAASASALTGSARLLLAGILALLAFSLGLLFYRFTLPTDGWLAMEPDGFDVLGLIYQQNVMGLPSDLQPDDWVTAVNGIPVDYSVWRVPAELVDAWQVGQVMQYTVQRDGQTLTVAVPLTYWDARRLLRATLFRDVTTAVSTLGLLIFFAASLLAFWQRPENPAARTLFALAGFILIISITLDVMPQLLGDYTNAWVNTGSGGIILAMFSVLLPPSFIRLGLVFPRPKPVLIQHPWLAYVPYVIGAGTILAFFRQMFVINWLWTGISVFISLLLLVHNAFTMRDTISRGQMRWALGGAILGTTLFSLNYVGVFSNFASTSPLGQLLSAFSGLGVAVMGISLAVAILRYQLFDFDVIVNRSLVYGTLTLGVITMYILVVGYLGFLFQTEANLAISLIATGIVTVLIAPLHNLVQRGVNRLMYGERDEPYRVLTRLGRQLETTLEPASALSLTVETVAQALKLPYVAIALNREDALQKVAVYGVECNEIDTFPLVYAGQAIGELKAASRAPNESFTPTDTRLLSDLARQISVTAHAVSLSVNLEQARLALVTERGEARRQLGSDLHDDVGHQLVGLTHQIESTMALAANHAALTHRLTDINRQLVALTGHVRELAHQLFPPELELLGLVGALRERTQTYSHLKIQVDAPVELPPLPAELETAAYYIALEALTNVDKHAQAKICRIRLRLSAGQPALMELDIRDDGVGGAAATSGGLGFRSMQARAAEVGGTCSIGPNLNGGTAVIVRIPYLITTE